MKHISGVVCWSQYNWLTQPVMSALKIYMSDHCRLFSRRYLSHSWIISLKVGSLTCWYRSTPRSHVYSEFSGIAPGGAFEQSRSGRPATLPGSGRQWCSGGRTTGIVEPCIYHELLRRLCSKPAAGGFACGSSSCAHEIRRGVDMAACFGDDLAHNIKPRVVCEVSRSAFFVRTIFPVAGVM